MPKRKIEKKDVWVSLILLVLALFLGVAIYLTYERKPLTISGEPVGVVQYKYHVVMRKFADRMLWEEVNPGSDLFLYDSILTKDESDAQILLKNGLHIFVEPNSLIVIEPTEKELAIKLQEGSLYTSGSAKKSTILLSENTELEVHQSRVRIVKNQDKIFLQAEEGPVILKKGKKETKLAAGESIELDRDGVEKKERLVIVQLSPAEGALIRTRKPTTKLAFRWESPLGNEQKLVLGKDPSLKSGQSVEVKDKSEVELELAPGKYFWQVRDKDRATKVQSFRIKEAIQLEILSPKNEEVFPLGKKISFEWKKSDPGETVLLEVSKDRSFSEIHTRLYTSKNHVKLSLHESGRYFWRISVGGEFTSEVRHFVVKSGDEFVQKEIAEEQNTREKKEISKKEIKLGPPVIIQPLPNEKFAHGEKVLFMWKKDDRVSRYVLELWQKSPSKKESYKTERNSYELTLEQSGRWYWRVIAQRGKERRESAVSSFVVRSSVVLDPPIIKEVRVE
ncbi:MAG: hypothetical protein NZM25_01870 [Leptospiraceae bacterium]|nr:hypothetical protein [Leptospiraceae bacterium]MDW8306923.1 hypothetical protein [Leptospiraceae bacterium]